MSGVGVYAGGLGFPGIPTWSGSTSDLPTYIVQLILWALEVPLIALYDLLVSPLVSFVDGADTSGFSIGAYVGTAFTDTSAALRPFGVLAVPIAVFVWGVAIVLLAYFIMFAIGIVIRQGEKDAEEGVEEA